MRRAVLQWRFGEDLGNHVLQAFQTVGAYQPKSLDASLIYVIEHLAPAVSTLRGLVVDVYHLPRLVLLHGQQDIERFRIDAALAVNLDMHAVNEQDWIVCFQPVPESGPCCTMCLQVSHTLLLGSLALRGCVGENSRTCHVVS